MKPVRRLAAEPPTLAAYRAANPADDMAPADQASQVWRRFRDDPACAAVLDALREAQQGLCIYCEQRVVDGNGALVRLDHQIEHMEPKSGAAGRVLDWRNLALACCGGSFQAHKEPSRGTSGKGNESCGQHKGEAAMRPHCDPRDFPPGARLVDVGLDGTLAPDLGACNQHGLPWENRDRPRFSA